MGLGYTSAAFSFVSGQRKLRRAGWPIPMLDCERAARHRQVGVTVLLKTTPVCHRHIFPDSGN